MSKINVTPNLSFNKKTSPHSQEDVPVFLSTPLHSNMLLLYNVLVFIYCNIVVILVQAAYPVSQNKIQL